MARVRLMLVFSALLLFASLKARGAEPPKAPRVLNPAGDRLLLNRPMGMGFDTRGRLFVADLLNRRIRIFAPFQPIPEKDVIVAGFLVPWAMAIDDRDRLFVTDTGANVIRVINTEKNTKTTIGRKGQAPGLFRIPAGIAIDEARQRLIIADFANHAVQMLTFDGTFLGHIGTVDAGGKFGKPGRREGEFRGPADVAVDTMGRIYVADKENCRIQLFHATGGFIASFGQAGATAGNFDRPAGLCVDGEGYVYVCDTFNNRVQMFEPPFAGALEPSFKVRRVVTGHGLPGGSLKLPNKCAVSPAGDLYIADTGNNRIVVYPMELLQ